MRRVQIRKVATLGTGHTPSRSVPEYWVPGECTIPWLTLADVWQVRGDSTTVVTETREKISPLGVANSSAVVHPAGTVAFSRTASVGFSCILGADMATSQDWVTWTCGPDLDPRYLLWVLRAEREQILGRSQGSTHKTIYLPDIEALTIPLPSLQKQRQIAKWLEAETERFDQLVATKRRMIEVATNRLESVRHEVFAAVAKRVPLRRLAERLTSGPRGWASYIADEGMPFLRITNLQRSNPALTDADLLRVDPPAGSEADRTRVACGDVVVSITANIGSVGVVDERFVGGFVSQHLALITPNRETDSEWLANVIMSHDCQRQLEASQYGGTKTQLSLEDLLELEVPAVGGNDQMFQLARIKEQARATYCLTSALMRQVELLAERRRSLITAAVAGEMEVA